MHYDYWVETNLGKYIDYDHYAGVQCVDLAKHFIKNVLEFTPQSIGNAIEYYRQRNTSKYLKSHFKWIDNYSSFVPQKGDLCVFTSKTGKGHISVATGEGDTNYFYSYDQNFPKSKGEPMTKIRHTYNSLLGVHRPYNQSNIVLKDGWHWNDNGWYFIENGLKVKNQWKQDSKGWLYLGSDGYNIKSQWQKDSVDWCYLDHEGYLMTNGWVQDSQGWCFVLNDGHILRNGYAWDSKGKHWIDEYGHLSW